MRTEHINQLVKTAESCVEIGSLCKAASYFHRVLDLSRPGEFTVELALLRLSRVYRDQCRYDDAITFMHRAISVRPNEPRHQLALAELLLLNRDPSQALIVAYETIAFPMTQIEALALITRINDEIGAYEMVHCSIDSRLSRPAVLQ
jgi:tetratricopeptide (TPR) repeat protein